MRHNQQYTILDAANSNGAGNTPLAADFRNVVFALATDNNANCTVKFAGSIQEDKPDFDSVSSPTNQWDYIQVIDLQDGSAINGDTGVTLSGTDDNRQFEANVNGLHWVTAIISGYSAGNITVTARLFDNE